MNENSSKYQEVLDSYCQVCFVPFNRVIPRKIQEGEEICYCTKCKCRVHKCCYDMEANSTYISPKLREFVCQRCERKELADKACIICKKKQGALKAIGQNQVIHVFCGLMHKDINVTSYYPQITFKKSENYKQETKNFCQLCSKSNANQQCAMQSCHKKYHGYCIWMNLKNKQLQQQDPQCEKYYFGNGDNGNFDLTCQVMPRSWLFEQFDKVTTNFQEYGFKVQNSDNIKEEVYKQYEKQENQQRKNDNILKRGGFAYVLCKQHESSLYCNCMNKGSGDMVLCQCCFQWYHQKCVNYQPNKASQHYVCNYCQNFYDLKKKIVEEVKNSKIQQYELKFQSPKMHLNDYIWLMRVIDHRIAGGASAKMIKQLVKYPLKTSKMELVVRIQNKKKIANLTQLFIQRYLQSKQHEALLKPRPVLALNQQQKPIILHQNVQYNKKLKKYVDYMHNFVRKNNLKDSFGSVIHQLKFKQRAVQNSYQTILQLSKSHSGYPQIPILKIKIEQFSFIEVIKDLDSGSMIKFQDLQNAVLKAKNPSANVPSYLLKPLVQRYEKVKSLVDYVSKNIHQNKECSNQTQNAVKKLKQQKISLPKAYINFHEEKKFINELYLLYLKQQGKPLQQSIETGDKIQILLKQAACKPNRQIAECVNSFNLSDEPVFQHIGQIVEKYEKMCLIFQLKDSLRKKNIKLSTLQNLYKKYQSSGITESETEITELMQAWGKIRKQWVQNIIKIQSSIDDYDNITQLTNANKIIKDTIQAINNLPINISDKSQQILQLGSFTNLQKLKDWIDTLIILFTQSQLKKNPLTISKLPEGLTKQNSLVKEYLSLKKEQNQFIAKFNTIYFKINQKIENLKDLKKPRKDQLKQVSQKPKLTDVNHFIDQLKDSKLNMEAQIKQLTKSVNKSLEIGSKVSKFISQQHHLQSIFKQEQADNLRKQIDELRRKVLLQAEICLQHQFKQLYQAQICVRMQKMLIVPNSQLDKMSKLLKFAEQEGLNHLPTYKRLKSKFQIGNQFTKQINITKKHQQILNSEAQKLREADQFYSSLLIARKALPLSLPLVLKQKNKHYQDLLAKNQYLKNKIDFILSEQPKKFEIQQAKAIYLQALKHPFQIQGLNKLINQFQKAIKVLNIWKSQRQYESSTCEIFIKQQDLIFHIQEIEQARKTIQQCQQLINSIKKMRKQALDIDSLVKVQEYSQAIQLNNISKNGKVYYKFKIQYYNFWVSILQKFKQQQNQYVPFNKIKSILLDMYSTIQRNYKNNLSCNEIKQHVNYMQDLMVGIRNRFQEKGENIQPIYQNFIDLQQLKYEVSSGLDIKDQLKILNPYNDINKFSSIDLARVQSTRSHLDESTSLKRQRTQNQLEDPYNKETKQQRTQKNFASQSKMQQNSSQKIPQQWQKNEGNIVSEAQRNKAKQVLLKNIKKNPQLASYENLNQQVKMIQNQLFGDNHNQVYKYFQFVNSFEKLFIKLLNCPNISIKVTKKKFEWNFLKLLVENINQIGQIQSMLIQKNKQTNPAPPQRKQLQKKQSKEIRQQKQKQKIKQKQKDKEAKKQQQPKQKQLTIQQMIAMGKIDQSVRRQIKKQIKAIKDKNKKKKHKHSKKRSRSRSRSSSRSRQAKFSSDSQQNQQVPVYIEKDYIQAAQKSIATQYFGQREVNDAPLLYDPQLSQQQNQTKKVYPKGAILQIKTFDMELSLRKKGKVVFKSYLMTTEDYNKIITQLVDPGFNLIQLKRDKNQNQIIQYLNKPSRKKYKFLVGWFQADQKQSNQYIRDFAIQCDQKGKIFGHQNNDIKMHVMSIQQYIKIIQLFDPPNIVSSEVAAEALRRDRLIYVIQYPSDRIYELKGIYQNFNNIQVKSNQILVQIPQLMMNPISIDSRVPYMVDNYLQGYNPLMQSEPMKIIDNNPLKPVQYEGWGNTESTISVASTFTGQGFQTPTYNSLNLLSRFSPIMTDQQQNNGDEINKQKAEPQHKQTDLASNILNSLADVNIKEADIPPISRRYQPPEVHQRQQPRYDAYRYQPMPSMPQHSMPSMPPPRWQPHGMMPNQMPPNQMMAPQMRMNMPYNPMSMAQKYPPPSSSMMYKNPMMPMAPPPYGYMSGAPPQNQPKPPGSLPYDPYMYQRQ